jgi:hypothetical protein
MIPNPAFALAALSLTAFLLLMPCELRAAAKRPGRRPGGHRGKGNARGASWGKGGNRGTGGGASGAGGPDAFPPAPPWSLPLGGESLELVLQHAVSPPPGDGETPEDQARNWDALRMSARALRGPGDPRCWAALSRSALALARDRHRLSDAAALAAGALEGLAGPGAADPDGETEDGNASGGAAAAGSREAQALLRETRFARKVLSACRARLGRAGLPVPPPAYCVGPVFHPAPDRPAPARLPGELRQELAAAELAEGAGSREALVTRSRLGEALAAEAALAGMPYAAGASGGSLSAEARSLLRSASGGLDELLGGGHPDALDARERLARFLAGGSGPGLPAEPLPGEIPPEEDLREALAIYLETAAVRAAAAARAAGARADKAKPLRRQAGKGASPAGTPEPGARRGDEAPSAAPSPETLELLARHGDEAAFAAAAGAAGCALALGEMGMSEALGRSRTYSSLRELSVPGMKSETTDAYQKLWKAAEDRLGPRSPATLRLMTVFAELRLADSYWLFKQAYGTPGQGRTKTLFASAAELAGGTAFVLREDLGAYAPETARANALLARATLQQDMAFTAKVFFSLALDALEGSGPGAEGAPGLAKITPDRPGRDRLALRVAMAGCLRGGRNPESVTALLAPFFDALGELPAGDGGATAWPWPPELAGRALLIAGETAFYLGEAARAEELLRMSLDALDPGLVDPIFLGTAFDRLSVILADRGDPASLREAAGLQERAAELRETLDGPGSLMSLMMLGNAAGYLELAGDSAGAVALHRKVLSGAACREDPDSMAAERSRRAIRRLGRQAR